MARQPAAKIAPAPKQAAPEAAAAPQPFIPRDGRAVVIGRDGKPQFRQTGVGGAGQDPYALANGLAPPDYVYEWKRYSTLNQVDFTYQAAVARVGGWEVVPAERHPGVWLPVDAKGAIIIDGLILMERHRALHAEAKAETDRAANMAVRKAKEERALAPRSAGIDTDTAAARNASFVREGRLLDGGVGKDGVSDAEALAQTRANYSYDRQTID